MPACSFELEGNEEKNEHSLQLTIKYRCFERKSLCGHARNNRGLLLMLLKYVFSDLNEPPECRQRDFSVPRRRGECCSRADSGLQAYLLPRSAHLREGCGATVALPTRAHLSARLSACSPVCFFRLHRRNWGCLPPFFLGFLFSDPCCFRNKHESVLPQKPTPASF